MGYFLMMNGMFCDMSRAKQVLQKSKEPRGWKIGVWGVGKPHL